MESDGKYKTHLIKNLTNRQTKYMPSISSISDLSLDGKNKRWSRRWNGGVQDGAQNPEEYDYFEYTSDSFGVTNENCSSGIASEQESEISHSNSGESPASSDNQATRSEFERYKSKVKDHYKKAYRGKYDRFREIIKKAEPASSPEDRDRVTKAALSGLGFWPAYNEALKAGLKQGKEKEQGHSLSKQISDRLYEFDTKGLCSRCKYNHVKDCEDICRSGGENGLDVVISRSKSGKVIDSFRVNLDPKGVNKGLINKINITVRSNHSGRMEAYNLSKNRLDHALEAPPAGKHLPPVYRSGKCPGYALSPNKGEFGEGFSHKPDCTVYNQGSTPFGQVDYSFSNGHGVRALDGAGLAPYGLAGHTCFVRCAGHCAPGFGAACHNPLPCCSCSHMGGIPQPWLGAPCANCVTHFCHSRPTCYQWPGASWVDNDPKLDSKDEGLNEAGSISGARVVRDVPVAPEETLGVSPDEDAGAAGGSGQHLDIASESDLAEEGLKPRSSIHYYSDGYANLESEALSALLNGDTKLHAFKLNNRGVNVPLFLNIGGPESVYSGQAFVTNARVGLFKISVVEPLEPKASLASKVAGLVGLNNFRGPACRCENLSKALAIETLGPRNLELFSSVLNTFADYTGIPWINPFKGYSRAGASAARADVGDSRRVDSAGSVAGASDPSGSKGAVDTTVCDFHKNLFGHNVDRSRFGKDLFCQLKYVSSITAEAPVEVSTDGFAGGANVSSFFNGFHEQLLCVGGSGQAEGPELRRSHRFTFIVRRVKGSRYGRNFTILNTTSGQHLCIDLLTHELRFEEECRFSKFLVPAIFKIVPARALVEAIATEAFDCFKPIFASNAAGSVYSVPEHAPRPKHAARYPTLMSTTDQFVSPVS